jgi:uncharacterized protein
MIIKLSEIDDTLFLKGSMEASRFMEVEKNEFHITTPVQYALTVKKFDTLLTVTGLVTLEASFTCGRCLEEFPQSINLDMDIRLMPETELPQAAEFELKDEDMDVYYYDRDEIDLDPFIYEEVLLNMPLRPVCKDNCQGLCGICGKNRNLETCNCNETSHTLLGETLKSFLN